MFTIGEVDFLKPLGRGPPGDCAPPAAGTKGRALDHIGFDVADEDAERSKDLPMTASWSIWPPVI